MRIAQVGHALIEWTLAHGRACDNLVVLAVENELELRALAQRLSGRTVAFLEPDLDNALTAVAAGPESWRELSSIRLA